MVISSRKGSAVLDRGFSHIFSSCGIWGDEGATCFDGAIGNGIDHEGSSGLTVTNALWSLPCVVISSRWDVVVLSAVAPPGAPLYVKMW